MNRRKRWIPFWVGCFVGSWIPFGVSQLLAYRDVFGITNLVLGESVTLISLSPDESMRVLLIERGRPIFGDRNFDVRLQKRGERNMKTVFTKTDTDMPAGRERIVWSLDSSQFILLSREPSFVADPLYKNHPFRLKNGEEFELLYNVQKKQIYIDGCPSPFEPKCLPPPRNILQKFQQEGAL
jgi:hypothetical protein